VTVFSPEDLFAASEVGVWYDPSPETTFTDTAGTTPATVGSAVALMLDKSKGLELGPELVTNGGFDDGLTGWSVRELGAGVTGYPTIVDGRVAVIRDSTNQEQITQAIPTVAGRFYILKYSNGSLNVNVGAGPALGSVIFGTTSGEAGHLIFAATTAETFIVVYGLNDNTPAFADNISVRELPGYHAVQPTAAARPILARVPASGRRNLLTRTEEFDNADWPTKTNVTVSANQTTAPDGTNTADLVVDNATSGQHRIFRGVTSAGGQTTISLFAKASTATRFQLATSNGVSTFFATFNLSSGSVSFTGAGATAGIVAVGDGWFRCSLTQNDGAGLSQFQIGLTNSVDAGSALPSYIGSGTGIFIWGAQLELGSTATEYQRVGSTYDVTEAGQADNYHLVFDGVDDSMVTPSIDFTGTDEMSVFAGVRKLVDAGAGLIAGAGIPTAQPGAFELFGPVSAAPNYNFRSSGTIADSGAAPTGFPAPTTNVLAGFGDIGSPSTALRVDGVGVGATTLTQGTGNYGNYPLYIGSRAGTALRFNGHLYSLLVRGALTADNLLNQTETYVASKTAGVDLT
jgi:hypothetical protein